MRFGYETQARDFLGRELPRERLVAAR